MARPERNTVDYFPFLCDEGKKMFYIEETYGNDGFATFIKILRELAKTDYHYLDLRKNTTQMFLSAKCKVSKEVLISIINDLAELGKFDFKLWSESRIIWCQDFIDSIQDAYKKRNNECITFDGLQSLLHCLGILNDPIIASIDSVKPQSKVKYIKVDKSKVKESNNIPEIPLEFPVKIEKEEVLITKKKRILKGKRLDTFKIFWEKFNYKKGRAEAADSWLEIPVLTENLCEKIYKAAELESKQRADIESKGLTPKMAQGWLSARRYEDESLQPKEKIKKIENKW